jgi:hypothetical protein
MKLKINTRYYVSFSNIIELPSHYCWNDIMDYSINDGNITFIFADRTQFCTKMNMNFRISIFNRSPDEIMIIDYHTGELLDNP